MIAITLVDVGWGVQHQEVDTPIGKQIRSTLIFQDKSGITVNIPMDENIARQVAAAIRNEKTVEVARSVPPQVNGHPIGRG